jgi:hypothetical protein
VWVAVSDGDAGQDLPLGPRFLGADSGRLLLVAADVVRVKAVSDPDWQAARQALDELMRKLLVTHRLLEAAEERLAKREPPADPT